MIDKSLKYLVELNKEYFNKKFLILAYFFSMVGEVDYKILNILIQEYFQNESKVTYSDIYQRLFIANENIELQNANIPFVRVRIINPPKWINKFSDDLGFLKEKYVALQNKNQKELEFIYFNLL